MFRGAGHLAAGEKARSRAAVVHTAQRKRRYRLRAKPRFWVLVLALSLCVAVFAAVQLFTGLRTYSEAKQEYDTLRLSAPDVVVIDSDAAALPAEETQQSAAPPTQAQPTPAPTKALAEINPEYVGWIEVGGTGISYPMAQGEDNDKYLTTTFAGEENKLGAIFLDARCEDGLDGLHTIIYGHNAKDGNMFAGLHELLALDAGEYPDISIVLPDGEALAYRVFAARETDIRDPAYRWEFEDDSDFAAFTDELGAPEDTEKLLTLSTCTSDGGDDKRLLVHAALE